MKTYLIFAMTALLTATSCSVKKEDTKSFSGAPGEVKLITLDPGHFHAALVQKNSYPQVADEVYVYAPAGDDVKEHLAKVETYNNRQDSPTRWEEVVYTGADFLEKNDYRKERKCNGYCR